MNFSTGSRSSAIREGPYVFIVKATIQQGSQCETKQETCQEKTEEASYQASQVRWRQASDQTATSWVDHSNAGDTRRPQMPVISMRAWSRKQRILSCFLGVLCLPVSFESRLLCRHCNN
jgi:hypothetical protein